MLETITDLIREPRTALERGAGAARTLASTLASARHRRLARDAVGLSVERTTEPITAELAAAYADATNDPNPLYRERIAPPFLTSRLVLPLLHQIMLDPRLKLNILRMVHAEQEMLWHRPLRVGDRDLRMRLTVDGIEETRAGELLRLRGEASRGTGELIGTANVGLMIRGRRRSGSGSADPEHGPELFRLELHTAPDQALRYAAASGDTNYIHTSRLVARIAGLPRPILHGMCVMAMTTGALVREWAGGDPSTCSRVRARFSHPVFPGDTLTLVAYEGDSPLELPFELLSPRGKPALKRGLLVRRSD